MTPKNQGSQNHNSPLTRDNVRGKQEKDIRSGVTCPERNLSPAGSQTLSDKIEELKKEIEYFDKCYEDWNNKKLDDEIRDKAQDECHRLTDEDKDSTTLEFIRKAHTEDLQSISNFLKKVEEKGFMSVDIKLIDVDDIYEIAKEEFGGLI